MALGINNMSASLASHYRLDLAGAQHMASLSKLSSGRRINGAADDAAGLAIGTQLQSVSNGFHEAMKNAQTGMNTVRTVDGALSGATSIMQRMRELAVQAGNGVMRSEDRAFLHQEMLQLNDELSRMGRDGMFGGKRLLDGSTPELTVQVGANAGQANGIAVDLSGANLVATATANQSLSLATPQDAQAAIRSLDNRLRDLTTTRAALGATENRISHAAQTAMSSQENAMAAASRIMDTDMALESIEMSRSGIQAQAGLAMQSQMANLNAGTMSRLLG